MAAYLRRRISSHEAVTALLIGLTFAGAGALDLLVWPERDLPLFYTVPVLIAASRSTPRIVIGTSLISVLLDLVGVARAGDNEGDWPFIAATLLAVCLLAVQFSRLRLGAERRAEEAERIADLMTRLRAVTTDLTTALTTAQVAEAVVASATAALHARAGLVALLTPGEDELEVIASTGYARDIEDYWQRIPIMADVPLAEVVRERHPIWLGSRDARSAHYPKLARDRHSEVEMNRAWAAVPLAIGERVLGGLGLSFREERTFTPEEQKLVLTLAAQCAQALERARLYEAEQLARLAAQRAADRTTRLQLVTAALSELRPVQAMAALIVEQGRVALGARGGSVLRLVDGGWTFEVLHQTGYPDQGEAVQRIFQTWQRFPVSTLNPAGEAVRTGEPIILEDGETRRAHYPHLGDVRLVLGDGAGVTLPLIVDDRAVGVMHLGFVEARTFDDDDRGFMRALAHQCALALVRAQYLEVEERVAAVVTSSDDAIYSVTVDNVIVTWNRGAERLYQYAAAEVIGKSDSLFVPPDRAQKLPELWARLKRGEPIERYATERIRKDGQRIDVSITMSPIRDLGGPVVAVSVIARDVTAEKRHADAQHLLAEAGRVLAAPLDGETTLPAVARLTVPLLADWCCICVDHDGSWNRRVAIAASDSTLEILVRDFFERSRRQLAADQDGVVEQILDSPQPKLVEIDGANWAPFDKLATRSLLATPLIARGDRIGALVVGRTRSRPGFQDRDLDLATELGRRTALAIDNARLYQETQRALRLRNEFLSIAAHELKTPITSLRGFAQLELLRYRLQGQVAPENLVHSLEIIDNQSRRLGDLVSRLLDITHLDAGTVRLERQVVDVTALVDGVVASMRSALTHQTIVVDSPPTTVARVDPIRIEEVVTNLLDNAVKYSPDGGVIEVQLARSGSDVLCLSVRDHGPGIIPERRGRIFERYYHADSENHRSGIGLGLHISQKIVQLHGGQISAEFPADGGTRIVVTLPILIPG